MLCSYSFKPGERLFAPTKFTPPFRAPAKYHINFD